MSWVGRVVGRERGPLVGVLCPRIPPFGGAGPTTEDRTPLGHRDGGGVSQGGRGSEESRCARIDTES